MILEHERLAERLAELDEWERTEVIRRAEGLAKRPSEPVRYALCPNGQASPECREIDPCEMCWEDENAWCGCE